MPCILGLGLLYSSLYVLCGALRDSYTRTKNGGLNYFAKKVAWGAHTVSPALAPSSYRILKLAERDTMVFVFAGCTIPSAHRFRKKTVTHLCENGPFVSVQISCVAARMSLASVGNDSDVTPTQTTCYHHSQVRTRQHIKTMQPHAKSISTHSFTQAWVHRHTVY